MDDGNKESIKEMLSTFRTLFAINVSGIALLINLNARNAVSYYSSSIFWIGMAIAAISLIAMIFLFFLAIPKIAAQDEAIIYQSDILTVSLVSFWSFIIAYVLLISNILLFR